MRLTFDMNTHSVITKKEWSVFYDMCIHHADQECFCEHVPDIEEQKCFTCEANEFLKDDE